MNNQQDYIRKAVHILRQGGIIIYPTDTAFGIGCRIDSIESVNRLFSLRRRPETQAMPVLVCSREMALAYFKEPPDIVRHLMEKYWPGALTIVAPCKKDRIVSPIRGGGNTVGMRMPDNRSILSIIEGAGAPILGPSANFHGEPTPYTLSDLNPELVRRVDYVVPGECTVKQASTVVDCSVIPYKILRQGAVLL